MGVELILMQYQLLLTAVAAIRQHDMQGPKSSFTTNSFVRFIARCTSVKMDMAIGVCPISDITGFFLDYNYYVSVIRTDDLNHSSS